MENIKKTVFVGMSGGVDSSVAALLLKQEGYTVVGVFIKVWHPDFLPCNWEAERLDAMRVAAHLDIPFLTCDAEDAYKNGVADYFIREYEAGRTPNPDVMCNTRVKFGHFFEFARAHGADYIATGHYARVKEGGGACRLYRGVDTAKDQSYFLWNVPSEALEHTLFPIGGLTKSEVREIAKNAELPTALKDESQGICFLGHVDIKEFLSHYMTLAPGNVLAEDGKVIGTHEGMPLYTIGQRHGFKIFPKEAHTEAYFVRGKDVRENTITVSHEKPENKDGAALELVLSETRTSFAKDAPKNAAVEVQTRYRQRPVCGHIIRREGASLSVRIEDTAEIPALGQSCVLYDGEAVCGGGIIDGVQNI